MASSDPIEPGPRQPPRGDRAWQAAQQEVADRNAAAQRDGKQQRNAHEDRLARLRRAADDPDAPTGEWR
jgi:hypothetical protein